MSPKLRHCAIAMCIATAGLIGTFVVAYTLRDALDREVRARFESGMSDSMAMVTERVRSYSDALYGLRALFHTRESVSYEDFRRYVGALDMPRRYPGFTAMSYAVHTRDESDLKHLVAETRKWYPSFQLQQLGPGPEHHIVVYIEPMQANFMGGDIASGAERIAALAKGIESGELLTTGRAVIRQIDGKPVPTIGMRVPVYRASSLRPLTPDERRATLAGSVGAGIKVPELLVDVLPNNLVGKVNFDLYNVSAAEAPETTDNGEIIYSRRAFDEHGLAVLETTEDFNFGGRRFRIRFVSPKDAWFSSLVDQYAVPVVSLAGIALSTMLAGLIFVLMDSRQQLSNELGLSREKLWKMAMYDSLTGLPNRTLLIDRMQTAIHYAERNGLRVWVLFIDLDRFKTVNDSLGHHLGDEMLKHVASRLQTCVRVSDTVARLGGDEFVVLLADRAEDHPSYVEVSTVAVKIARAGAAPIALGSHRVDTTASIGVCAYPEDAADVADLLRYADIAMYRAKDLGGNSWHLYSETMDSEVSDRLRIEEDLMRCLEGECGTLVLHYQPKLDLHTGKVCGAEALVRWSHPTRGLVPPGTFIPIAEESGLVAKVGAWVMRTADEAVGRWQRLGICVPVAVNVSLRQIATDEAIERLIHQLEALEFHALIELEITESVAAADPARIIALIAAARQHGIKVALDDFGTGYSSFIQLRNLDLDALKIDQVFVRNFLRERKDSAIVTTTITLARSLGMLTVAEGVETEEQAVALREARCDQIQGYFISPPLPDERFEAFVKDQA